MCVDNGSGAAHSVPLYLWNLHTTQLGDTCTCCLIEGRYAFLAQVPSFGILSNGTNYVFYKYTPEDRRLVKLWASVQLKPRITASEASAQVLPIIRHLVHIIQQQMQGLESFKKPRTG